MGPNVSIKVGPDRVVKRRDSRLQIQSAALALLPTTVDEQEESLVPPMIVIGIYRQLLFGANLRRGHEEPHNPRNGCQSKYRLDAQPRDVRRFVGDGSDSFPCHIEIEK